MHLQRIQERIGYLFANPGKFSKREIKYGLSDLNSENLDILSSEIKELWNSNFLNNFFDNDSDSTASIGRYARQNNLKENGGIGAEDIRHPPIYSKYLKKGEDYYRDLISQGVARHLKKYSEGDLIYSYVVNSAADLNERGSHFYEKDVRSVAGKVIAFIKCSSAKIEILKHLAIKPNEISEVLYTCLSEESEDDVKKILEDIERDFASRMYDGRVFDCKTLGYLQLKLENFECAVDFATNWYKVAKPSRFSTQQAIEPNKLDKIYDRWTEVLANRVKYQFKVRIAQLNFDFQNLNRILLAAGVDPIEKVNFFIKTKYGYEYLIKNAVSLTQLLDPHVDLQVKISELEKLKEKAFVSYKKDIHAHHIHLANN